MIGALAAILLANAADTWQPGRDNVSGRLRLVDGVVRID